MMDIEFVKWMCEKTEYFQVWKDKVYYMDEVMFLESLYYPLLLQRAIEGVNREGKYEIIQYNGHLNLSTFSETINDIGYSNAGIDQAKESALRYIYEQERKHQ